MRSVVVHIDRLVLKGFRPQDREAIAVGLQEELSRAFAAPSAARSLTAMGSVSRLNVGSVPVAQGSTPQRAGERVGQGIGKEMVK